MAPTTRQFALRAVKVSAATFDAVWKPARGIVVLLYHRVGGDSGLEIDLPTWLFAEQMARLAEEQRVITLDAALVRLAQPPSPEPGPDPVVVTFDDGTADFADAVLPILERHRVPATLYVATAFIEGQRRFPGDGTPLSWDALADTVSTGLVTIGSHTHSHALLDRLPVGEIDDELGRSTGLIEDCLGVRAEHFAYPKAVPGSPEAGAAVRRRFRSAAVAGTRANPYGRTDPYRLARSPVQVSDGMRWFEHKVAGGMRLEDAVRRAANRRRYAGATT